MKTRILLSMLFCCFFIAAYGQTCGYCNGTGKMIINKGIATYGNDELVWCKECQKHFHRSTGHMHIHCKYCKGTGRRQSSSNNSSSGGYTSTDEIAAIDPQAYGMAMNALYGLPSTEEEMNLIRKMLAENETNGRRYIEYRNNLNSAKIHFTQMMRMGNYSGTVQELDKYFESVIRRANEIMENLYFPYDRALRILQEHAGTVEAAYKSYRSAVGFQQNLNNLNDQLFMQELMRNSIY